METILIQINNSRAFNLIENLEALNIIKVLKRSAFQKTQEPISVDNNYLENDSRLSEIRSITKNINIDLSNFHFDRDEANNYD